MSIQVFLIYKDCIHMQQMMVICKHIIQQWFVVKIETRALLSKSRVIGQTTRTTLLNIYDNVTCLLKPYFN